MVAMAIIEETEIRMRLLANNSTLVSSAMAAALANRSRLGQAIATWTSAYSVMPSPITVTAFVYQAIQRVLLASLLPSCVRFVTVDILANSFVEMNQRVI